MKRGVALCLGLGLPLLTSAGHGLMNAFGDIEWLPSPGRTPDQWSYPLDAWQERMQLALAPAGAARVTRCLRIAREKIAEAEAMVKREQAAATAVASRAYGDALARTVASIAQAAASERPRLREQLAKALLEHQYIVSVDYLDLPRASRPALAAIIDDASRHYAAVRALLPPAVVAAAFFREEEVRWSWEMAQRADQQNL